MADEEILYGIPKVNPNTFNSYVTNYMNSYYNTWLNTLTDAQIQALYDKLLTQVPAFTGSRYLFERCYGGGGGAGYESDGYMWGYKCNGAAAYGYIYFRIPNDFNSLDWVKVLLLPQLAQVNKPFDWTCLINHFKVGEKFPAGLVQHAATCTEDAHLASEYRAIEIDVSAAASGANAFEAGDDVGCIFTIDAIDGAFTNILVAGIVLKYH